MIHDSFIDFMEKVVLPRKSANPTHLRLDGWTGGGNFDVAGRFRHRGKVWKVHADTRYEPLVIAYNSIKDSMALDPFTEESTKNGTCLVLDAKLRSQMGRANAKYIYIYQD
jgi:hypothetical protein